MHLHWQKLPVAEPRHEFVHATVHRTPVPGGWLVCVVYNAHNVGGPALCFYPDQSHEWDGASLPLPGFEDRQPAVSH